MRKKLTIASLVTLCAVPLVMPSKDASAFPVFARKYQTSCYTCHSGFPARNAFGEAFKNNGYRWPGGEDEDHARQEQVKLGSNGWKKVFPESPWPGDLPGYAPFSAYLQPGLFNWTQSANGAKGQTYWGKMNDARILYAGTIGDNLSIVGAVEGLGTGNAITSNLRAVWSFSPGLLLSAGNWASNISGAGSSTGGTANVASVLPTPGTGVEVSWTKGQTGGFNVVAGVSNNGVNVSSSTDASPTWKGDTNLNDLTYVRAKYKLFGSGLLSGAGGVYGNEYNGLDNSLTIGGGAAYARTKDGTAKLTGSYAGEGLVYGADLLATYGNFTGGAAVSRDRDLEETNYIADAGYYLYPWLYAKVRYSDIYSGSKTGVHNPTFAPSITAYLRANVYLQATYTAYARGHNPSNGTDNANTFALTAAIGL